MDALNEELFKGLVCVLLPEILHRVGRAFGKDHLRDDLAPELTLNGLQVLLIGDDIVELDAFNDGVLLFLGDVELPGSVIIVLSEEEVVWAQHLILLNTLSNPL